MSDARTTIPRMSDPAVLSLLREIVKTPGARSATATVQVLGQNYDVNLREEPEGDEQALIENAGGAIERAVLQVPQRLTITYVRGGGGEHESPFYDEVIVARPSRQEKTLALAEQLAIRQCIDHVRVFGKDATPLPKEVSDTLTAHQTILTKMEEAVIDITTRLEKQYQEKENALAKGIEAQEKALASQHAEKICELDERSKTLDKREQEIDIRDNTVARRAQQHAIVEELKKRQQSFRLTEGTEQKRRPIQTVCVALMVFFPLIAVLFNVPWPGGFTHPEYLVYASSLVSATGFIGVSVFYVRWLNRWFDKHADAEFRDKQFELDIDRASWLVETALEWSRETSNPMPDLVASSLSRNLFAATAPSEDIPVHPLEQFATALLGNAAAVKLKSGDAEVSLDRKSIKEIRKSQS